MVALKLRPSAKLNKRYLLIKGSRESVEQAILDYLGILGWAKAAPAFISSKDKEVILSVNRQELSNVTAAFALVKDIELRKVSGTLAGLGK